MVHFDKKMIRRFDFGGTYTYWKQLELNKSGKINTWFVFWYANMFLRGGLALFPSVSLVKNIGFDNSGVHCTATSNYDAKLSERPITLMSIALSESIVRYLHHVKYYSSIRQNLATRKRRWQ